MKKLNYLESSSYLEQSTITFDDFTTLRSHESIISDETLKILEDKLKLKKLRLKIAETQLKIKKSGSSGLSDWCRSRTKEF